MFNHFFIQLYVWISITLGGYWMKDRCKLSDIPPEDGSVRNDIEITKLSWFQSERYQAAGVISLGDLAGGIHKTFGPKVTKTQQNKTTLLEL